MWSDVVIGVDRSPKTGTQDFDLYNYQKKRKVDLGEGSTAEFFKTIGSIINTEADFESC